MHLGINRGFSRRVMDRSGEGNGDRHEWRYQRGSSVCSSYSLARVCKECLLENLGLVKHSPFKDGCSVHHCQKPQRLCHKGGFWITQFMHIPCFWWCWLLSCYPGCFALCVEQAAWKKQLLNSVLTLEYAAVSLPQGNFIWVFSSPTGHADVGQMTLLYNVCGYFYELRVFWANSSLLPLTCLHVFSWLFFLWVGLHGVFLSVRMAGCGHVAVRLWWDQTADSWRWSEEKRTNEKWRQNQMKDENRRNRNIPASMHSCKPFWRRGLKLQYVVRYRKIRILEKMYSHVK